MKQKTEKFVEANQVAQSKPTFDLTEVIITEYSKEDRMIFCKSKQVLAFDGVMANMINRSRVLRTVKEESRYTESVIAATIDAGFIGHLFWKIKLTIAGDNLFNNTQKRLGIDYMTPLNPDAGNINAELSKYFSGCQQLQMINSPAGNYYDGTNQTNLQPDILFTL